MKKSNRRSKLLVEPPPTATGDIAFNLIVFFLVCASVQPDSGHKQTIPKSETVEEESQQNQNIKVQLTRTAVMINGQVLPMEQFRPRMEAKLADKSKPEERVVVVSSKKQTPYDHWITVTRQIEQAGGIITLQLEEERKVQLPE